MKFTDLKIGLRLGVGVGLILALVGILGVVAWRQAHILWMQTRIIHEHPLRVTQATLVLEADLLAIHLAVHDLALAGNPGERARAIRDMDSKQADALIQLRIISDRYLGPARDITSIHEELAKCIATNGETVRMLRDGRMAQAMSRIKDEEPGGRHANMLLESVRKVKDFARNKADEIFRESGTRKDALIRQLIVIVAAIMLLSVIISVSVWSGIKDSLLNYEKCMQAEASLNESEEKFRRLFEDAPACMVLVDADGNILEANARLLELTGVDREGMLGRNLLALVRAISVEAPETVDSNFRKLEAGTAVDETVFRDRAGNVKTVKIQSAKFDRGGRPGDQIFMLQDITEHKRADDEREKMKNQLTQLQKMESIGRLAGGVAHDFNNILGVIMGRVELAMDKIDGANPMRRDLEQILSAAKRSADIAQQLLAFARKQTVAPRIIDVNESLTGILNMLRQLIGEDIDLAWSPGAGLWPVMLDPSQLDQIMVNLCVNARDAITGNGKITIETGNVTLDDAYCAGHEGIVPGDYVMLAVSDNGTGMDKETMEHIFEPFYTTKKTGRGTGLGLAMIFGVVKQNEGLINVYSEQGEGTTFKIYLPAWKNALVARVKESAEEVPRGRGETILLVEDEPAILEMANAMLGGLGYAVLSAGKPNEAIRLAMEKKDSIRLLVTDVIMPDMNGRDLAERILAICPGLRCLYMSGYTADVIAHRGVLDEGTNFIQKPFSRRNLAAKVREVLDGEVKPA